MKRILIILALIVTMTMFTGCYSCDLCGEQKIGFGNKTKVLGMSIKYCNDCKNGLNSLKNEFKKEIKKAKNKN